jgi:hypothetical protein
MLLWYDTELMKNILKYEKIIIWAYNKLITYANWSLWEMDPSSLAVSLLVYLFIYLK